MSFITGVAAYGVSSYQSNSLLNSMTGNDSDSSTTSLANTLLQASNDYSGVIASQINSILASIGADENGEVTADNLSEAVDTLADAFEEKVKSDLQALGVDEDVEFTVTYAEGTGSLKVTSCSDSASASVIQQYFNENPDLADTFHNITMISKVADLVDGSTPTTQFRKSMELEFIDELSASGVLSGDSLTLGFSADELLKLQGVNLSV